LSLIELGTRVNYFLLTIPETTLSPAISSLAGSSEKYNSHWPLDLPSRRFLTDLLTLCVTLTVVVSASESSAGCSVTDSTTFVTVPTIFVIDPTILSGNGVFVFDDGAKFEGDWIRTEAGSKRMRHGKGKMIDGPEIYNGEWDMDKMNGSGTYTFATGATYEGNFKENRFSGKGIYTWADGSTYDGEWRENKMHGNGIYTDKEGVKWEGKFFNGKYDNGYTFINLR